MNRLLNVAKYMLLLGLSGALMWYALRNLDFTRILTELQAARWEWVLLSVAVTIPGYFSRAWRWKMQIDAAGQRSGFWATYHAMMVGYLANLVLPRAGEVVRCTVLARTAGVPVKVGLGTVITERVIDVLMLFSLTGLLLLLEFEHLQSFLYLQFNDQYDSIAANRTTLLLALAAVGVGAALIGWFVWHNFEKFRHNPHFQRAANFLRGLISGVLSVRRVKPQGLFWFHTFFTWGTYFFTAVALFPALPSTADLGMNVALALLVIGGFGMAAPVQGGIGVFHLLVQGALIAYGLGKEQGMAYALISHTTQTVLVVVMGGISFVASMVQTAKLRRGAALSDTDLLEIDEGDGEESSSSSDAPVTPRAATSPTNLPN
jgi:glycosyltransferase 2 family protein